MVMKSINIIHYESPIWATINPLIDFMVVHLIMTKIGVLVANRLAPVEHPISLSIEDRII